MTRELDRRAVLAGVAALGCAAATPAYAAEPQEIVDKATYVAKRFTGDDSMDWARKNVGRTQGILIIPSLLKAGFIFGGSAGAGVLLARGAGGWSPPAFYTMGSGTVGLQIGAEMAEIVLLVVSKKGMEALLSTDFKLGGDISVAAGPVGLGAKAQTADVLSFARTKGLYGGINLEGAVVATRAARNKAYYGRAVSPADILYKGAVSNPAADNLRAAVAQLGA